MLQSMKICICDDVTTVSLNAGSLQMYILHAFLSSELKSLMLCFRHQAMATGGLGGPGASVLAHVEEEYSLPIATAITRPPETVAATAQGREPSTAPAVSRPARLMVRCSPCQPPSCVRCHLYSSSNK